MRLERWLDQRGGIASREDVVRAGFGPAAVTNASVRSIGRRWIATANAPSELVAAAEQRALLACSSAAVHRGLAILHRPSELHLWASPRAHPPGAADGVRRHRSLSMVPPARGTLLESVPDMLAHVAHCLPHVEALVVWESAIRKGLVEPAELRRYRWLHPVAEGLRREAGDRSDSLLETIAADLLRHAGVPFQQQVPIQGHRVDLLVGARLVVEVDGFEFHDGAQRRRDLEQDARLQLAGYRVLRFAYADLVGRPDHVLMMIRRHLALVGS